MRQIRGIKGEAVVNYWRTLDNKGDGVSSTFPACWVVAESDLSGRSRRRSLKPKGANLHAGNVMKRFNLISLLSLFVLFYGCSAAPIKVVFDSPQQIKGINNIAVFPFVCNRSETGRIIAEALAANLSTSRFAVIEQGQLQTLLKANRLTPERVSENHQLIVGKLKGVDAVITGDASVRAFGGYSEHVAEATARMIDVTTGKTLLEVTFLSENVKSLKSTTPADQIGKELAQKFSSY